MTTLAVPQLGSVARALRTSGPYLLLELLMPGGTLLALLLFYYQRRSGSGSTWRAARRCVRRLGMQLRQFLGELNPRMLAPAWRTASRTTAWHP